MQLILLRHGEPAKADSKFQIDPPLTDLGHYQAECLSNVIVKESPDVLISSPLLRAKQTGQPSAEKLDKAIIIEPSIAEVDGTGGHYIHVEDLRKQGGSVWASFLKDPVAAMGGDDKTFRRRVLEGFENILTTYQDADKVAVFTHGFPINVILAHILGISQITRFAPNHASVTRIGGSRLNRLAILSFNEMSHLSKAREM